MGPVVHLREVLGDEAYESLASAGEEMTTAAIAAYALEQIDQARAELETTSTALIGPLRRPQFEVES